MQPEMKGRDAFHPVVLLQQLIPELCQTSIVLLYQPREEEFNDIANICVCSQFQAITMENPQLEKSE